MECNLNWQGFYRVSEMAAGSASNFNDRGDHFGLMFLFLTQTYALVMSRSNLNPFRCKKCCIIFRLLIFLSHRKNLITEKLLLRLKPSQPVSRSLDCCMQGS